MCLLAGRSTARCFPPHCRNSAQAPLAQRSFLGSALGKAGAARAVQPLRAVRLDVAAAADSERLRLHNLSPQKGSRRDEKRKGRGYGGHQVGTEAACKHCACQAYCRTLCTIPAAAAAVTLRAYFTTQHNSLMYACMHMPSSLCCCGRCTVQGGNCGFGNRGQKARLYAHAIIVMLLRALYRAGWYLRFWKPRSEGSLRPISQARL
jgi:hypothetical protein